MPKIKVNDQLVIDVDKNFFNLSADEKNKIVDDAVNQDAISGTGKAFASGVLFNLRDEVVAALSEPSAALSELMGDAEAGSPYRAELSRQRALESAFRQQAPVTSTVAEIAGGLAAPAGILGQIAKAPTIAGRVFKGMGAGAGLGALSGAGASEEGERLGGAGIGGTVGAVAAPVAMAAAPVAKFVGKPVAQTVGRLTEAGFRAPENRAARMVARRLKEAGISGKELEALKKSPKPQAVADIDSEGVAKLSRLVAQAGGKGSELARSLNARQFGTDKIKSAAERIEQDLIDAGVPTQSAREAKIGLDKIKEEVTAPLYREMNELQVPEGFRNSLRPLFERPAVKSALPAAKRLAANRGEPFVGDTVDNLDFNGFNNLQKALNNNAQRQFALKNYDAGTAIKGIRDEIVERMKSVNKPFKEAFDLYGDIMGNERALEHGSKFRSFRDPDEIKDIVSKMSESEKHNFRVGVAQEIRNAIEKASDGSNIANVIAKSKQQLRQLKEAFPEGGMDNLEKALDIERTMAAKRQRIMGGSQTFETAAQAQRAGLEDALTTEKIIEGTKQSGFFGGLASAVQGRVAPAMMGIGEKTSRELGNILFETDPARRAAIINRLQGVGRLPEQPAMRPSIPSRIGLGAQALPSAFTRGALFDVPTTMSNEYARSLLSE
jgi:hypothetical protein